MNCSVHSLLSDLEPKKTHCVHHRNEAVSKRLSRSIKVTFEPDSNVRKMLLLSIVTFLSIMLNYASTVELSQSGFHNSIVKVLEKIQIYRFANKILRIFYPLVLGRRYLQFVFRSFENTAINQS